MMIQTPLGPFLPGGISIDVDNANTLKLDYQTCDAKGCYAGAPVSDEMLQSMFRGQKLNLTVQALNKQPIKIPLDLTGFTAAYRKVQ
jgi:invasion protein IalB